MTGYATFDGQCWPVPDGDLEWRLRYSREVRQSDALHAASIVAAYAALIRKTRRERDRVVRRVRAADRGYPSRSALPDPQEDTR